MNYTLRTEQAEQPVASANLADNFAAERWAKNWVSQNGSEDRYLLEREGGGFAEIVFKTNAGQWYVTPKQAA